MVAQDIASALRHLHKLEIVFRDLKPDNVGFDFGGRVKLFDFGLAKELDPKQKTDNGMYKMSGGTGSRRFMAPEVYRHEEYNETVDVYSFSMIFFYLLIGRPPWPALPGLEAVRKAALEGDRPNIPRDVDVRLQALLKETWDDNPSVRPAFSKISSSLSAYNKDVYKTDTNAVASAEADSKCRCIIM